MIIDYKLFLDLLILLIHSNNDLNVESIIDEIINIYEENRFSIRDETEILFLVKFIKEIRGLEYTYKTNKNDLIALFNNYKSSNVLVMNKDLKDSLSHIINNEFSINTIINIMDRSNNFILWTKSNKYVGRIYSDLQNASKSTNPVTQKNFLANMLESINELKESLKIVDKKKAAFIERINFEYKNDIQTSFEKFKDRRCDYFIKTGLQGLNKMCGKRNGFALGESVVFPGLSHNFKSSMLMSIAKWIIEYNVKPKTITDKKPMILFISLENEAFENMMWWFDQTYVVLTGKDPDKLEDNEKINYIYEYFNKNDFTFVIERYLPGTLSYNEYVKLYESYEKSGYIIICSIIDYLQQMNFNETNSIGGGGPSHLLIKNLFSNMCNFHKAKGTTLFTGHQLNRAAGEIVATKVPYPVKRFSGIHLAYSADVEREPDFIIYLHIEKNNEGDSYLTMQWGKHRYVNDTIEKDKFIAYKFNDLGIPDDIYKKTSKGVHDIYNIKKLSKEEKAIKEAENMIIDI